MAKPLSSVHAASSDGAHEAQQRDEPIGVVTREASMSAAGSWPGSTGGMNAARATFQNGLDKRRRVTSRQTDGADRAEDKLADREIRGYEAEYVGSYATFHQLLLACDRDLADTARGAGCNRAAGTGECSAGPNGGHRWRGTMLDRQREKLRVAAARVRRARRERWRRRRDWWQRSPRHGPPDMLTPSRP